MIRELISVQLEILKLEKDNLATENELLEKEAELKAQTKKDPSGNEGMFEKRKEVDKLRENFQKANHQL